MKVKIYHSKQWQLHKEEIQKLLESGKDVNLSYEIASKEKTKKQIGFFFSALCSQIKNYLVDCGFNVSENDVKYGLYSQVSKVVPEMIVDNTLFGNAERILHISDMDRTLMSKFIDGVFQVIDNNPMYSGLKLTPDVRYNWAFHLTIDDLILASKQELPQKDEQYLNYIREQPCIICGKQHRSHAHHLKDMLLCGLAQRAPDWATIPLCPDCHLGIAHGTGFKESMKWLPISLVEFTRMYYLRYKNNRG